MIVIIVPPGLSVGVFSSQIIPLANYLTEKNKVVIFCDNELSASINTIERKFELINHSEKEEIKRTLKKANWIYIRSFKQFFQFYFIRKLNSFKFKIFYDFRGLVYDESFLRNGSYFRKSFIFLAEKYIARKADYLGAVSYNLKQFLTETFKTTVPIFVNPCTIEKVVKKNPPSTSEIKFVYMGGLSAWQCFDDILYLYKNIADLLNKSSLTVITTQTDYAEGKILKLGIKNSTVKSLTHTEVINDLPNYDFGFLIREELLLNKVASPIKFLEYTSNGVIPIITKGIGDFSEQVESNKLGIVLNSAKVNLKINDINTYLKDEHIYQRLYDFSKQFKLEDTMKNHPFMK